MFKSWKTSILGILTGLSMIAPVLSGSGVAIGHWGGTDFVKVAGGVSAMLLGLYAKDNNVTGQ